MGAKSSKVKYSINEYHMNKGGVFVTFDSVNPQ